jgi:hypothetical protein
MPNPAILVCDSDALVQFFLPNEVRPLRHLRDRYGIQPVITQEVDLEMQWLGRHRDRFVLQVEKALKSGILRVLDPPYFQSLLSSAPVGASWAAFQTLGAQYYGHVDRGEAFTFAAGVTLDVPALSNDFSAIRTLEAKFLSLPTPVLRTFDLIAFCHQSGCLDLKECNEVRSELLKNKEGVPKAFMNSSFEDGVANFSPRLREGATPSSTTTVATFSTTLYISAI